MKYADCKKIKNFCADLFSTPDWREVVESIEAGADDFTVDNVRFINSADIDRIQTEQLGDDLYILGCFNAWFIADVAGIDQEVIEAMQKAEAFEAIGKLIVSLGKLDELQQAYASADGYGHHFNSYDNGEDELTIDGTLYHVFDER